VGVGGVGRGLEGRERMGELERRGEDGDFV